MGHVLRPHQHPSYATPGGREDCWTEEATAALIEVWGERFVDLNRGNLRQKDWKDVSMAVNEHLTAMGKPKKTDIQCKNRIDTLKKKFKLERSKGGESKWVFYSRLEELICPEEQKTPINFTIKRNPNPNPNPDPDPDSAEGSFSGSKANSSPVSSESSGADEGKMNKDESMGGRFCHVKKVFSGRRRPWGSGLDIGGLINSGEDGGGDVNGAFGELAKAILKFGEVYEKVESSKQQQMIELERQRMEFSKEIEFQRMQMFMEAQLELEKMKRPKYSSGGRGEAKWEVAGIGRDELPGKSGEGETITKEGDCNDRARAWA
ncbi:trihelix transcription factor ENAP2-like isoform X2 [Wolffia australiana]